jgi:autotransporter-associated beta strand protein
VGAVTPSESTTTELDFLDSASSGYTATDDFQPGGFLLHGLVLANNTTNTDTIAAAAAGSLAFNSVTSGPNPYVTQTGSGGFIISASIGIDPNFTLVFGGSGTGTVTVSGSIGGGAGTAFTQTGVNTLVLSGSNSFAGAFSVTSGILNVQNSGALSGNQGYVNTGETLQLQNNITVSTPLQLQGSGAGGQNGVVVNVSGTNTIKGNIGFAGGTTNISSDSGTLIFSGATFSDGNPLVFGGAGNGVFAENSLSLGGGGTGITKVGSGAWYFNTPGTSFSKSLHLNGGTVSFVTGGLGTGFINPGGGVLQWAPGNTTDMSNSIGYPSSPEPLLLDTNGNNVTFASSTGYNNTGGLTKYGSGALIFTGNYNYTGGTTIAGGTLQFGNGGASGGLAHASAITDNSNLTFDLSSTSSQGTSFGAISGTGSVTLAGGGTVTFNVSNTYSGTTTVNAGTLQANNYQAFPSSSAVILANAPNSPWCNSSFCSCGVNQRES